MSGAGARVGVGTRFRYDGETVEVVEMAATTAGNEVVLKDGQGRVMRLTSKELLFSDRAPPSEDALVFARKPAAAKYRYPDDRLAVADLLERWNLGLGTTPAERRMALRASREQTGIDLPEPGTSAGASLASVRRALGQTETPATAEARAPVTEAGDDDEADLEELAAEEGFYADALEDV
ncbi:hypothetical protein [Streptomyces sp. NPDC052114]|uniref:hypothetical protein n=1 Tax=unclassified Streptomyces TaxID=2593676 RepID=UPI00341F79FD